MRPRKYVYFFYWFYSKCIQIFWALLKFMERRRADQPAAFLSVNQGSDPIDQWGKHVLDKLRRQSLLTSMHIWVLISPNLLLIDPSPCDNLSSSPWPNWHPIKGNRVKLQSWRYYSMEQKRDLMKWDSFAQRFFMVDGPRHWSRDLWSEC